MIRSLVTAFAFALWISLAACGNDAPTKGTGKGTVAGVDVARREITLDHGPIGDLMGAMTMTFTVSNPKLLEGVVPGAKVEFDVVYEGGEYLVTGVRPR